MNKFVLIAMSALAIIVGSMTISSAHASIIGDFGIGYNNGKIDAYNGYAKAGCSAYSYSYCAGYSAGYDAEIITLNQAQP